MLSFQLRKSPIWRILRLLPVWVMILIMSLAVSSQTPTSSQAEEMRKLDFLLGEWKGTGWEVHWDGSRGDEFSQKTKVEAKAGGSSLRIKDAKNYKTTTIGLLSRTSTLDANVNYDEGAKIYRWQGAGRKNFLEAKLIDLKTFQYGIPFTVNVPLPNGARRHTIKVTESGEWNETLDVWKLDRWYKVQESVLRRVK